MYTVSVSTIGGRETEIEKGDYERGCGKVQTDEGISLCVREMEESSESSMSEMVVSSARAPD